MHKTGSTSIQSSLNKFEDDQFVYADLKNVGNHSLPIYSLFSSRPEQHHLHRSQGRDAAAARVFNDQTKSQLEREIARAGGRTLIISGEDITALPPTDVKRLRDYFHARFDHTTIVAYVRPPAGLIASRFQQLVKGGSARGIDPRQIYRNYQASFEKFDASFGRENVKLWKFDPQTFPDGDVVQDFCQRFGIALPKNRIVRMNESLSRQAVSLVYIYGNQRRNEDVKKMQAPEAMRLGQLVGGDKFRFSPDLVRSILSQNQADIAWMEERLGESLHEEIGAERPGDVSSEADLLRPDPEAVSKLLRVLGRHAPPGIRGETTEEIARLIEAWRTTIRPAERWKRRDMMASLSRTKPVKQAQAIVSPVASVMGRLRELLATSSGSPATKHFTPPVKTRYHGTPALQSPYQDRPKSQFWRTGAAETDPSTIQDLYKPKFEITKIMRIATAGSCFAQHIGRRLRQRGFTVLDVEPAPPIMTAESAVEFGYGIYSARYGNIYLMRQLLQLAREAFGKWAPRDIVWSKDGKFFDALRPGVEPEGLDSGEEVVAHRQKHLTAVRELFLNSELFVFTFGLTEGWVHRASQTVYPTAPGTIAGIFDPTIYEFKNFTFDEIMADFLAFYKLIRSVNPKIHFLLTVSPVPLTATASDDHVLAATTYSKAVLRAVAGQLQKQYDDIDYFPSFELIATPWSKGAFFESNLRSVSTEGVDAVMRIFFAAHDPHGRDEAQSTPKREISEEDRLRRKKVRMLRQKRIREKEICEDAMLEAFNR